MYFKIIMSFNSILCRIASKLLIFNDQKLNSLTIKFMIE